MKLKEIHNKEWKKEYDRLMCDPYLSKKYNRNRRIRDKQKYIDDYCPEIKRCSGKLVLDIGPGPGEFLEICRVWGHDVLGVDSPLSGCEMGDEYIKLSQLMTQRQKIPVAYMGLEKWLEKNEVKNKSVFFINSQGSINQCFTPYLKGPSHRKTKKSSLQSWDMSEGLWNAMYNMFDKFYDMLEDGGYLLIYANGAANNPQYDHLILETLKKFPNFKLYQKQGKTLHKVRKVVS